MSEPAKKKRPSYNYSNEDFTKVWNECTTVEEVSTRTGMPKPSCQSKASILRKKGFTLKMLQRGRRKTSENIVAEAISMVQPTNNQSVLAKAQERLEAIETKKVADPAWSEAAPTPTTADELNNGGADAA